MQKVIVQKRAVLTLFKIKDFHFVYAGAYLPTNSNDSTEFETALKELSDEITRLRIKHKKFAFCIAGDLNIDVKHSPQRQKIFKSFLVDLGGYHWIPEHPSYEHKHWKTTSYLDGIVISDNIAVDEIKNITETEVEGNRSDHEPVLFKLLIETKVEKPRKKKKGENEKYIHSKRINWDNVDCRVV